MNDCIFCKIINGEIPSYKVYEDNNVLSFLSIDPEGYGHTLVIPKKHYVNYSDIPLDELNHINEVGKIVFDKIKTNLKPDGIRLVQNNGCIQEVKHYHLHLVPVFEIDKVGKKNFEEVLKNIKED